MSYDLMVFNTKNAPKNKEDFLVWYNKKLDWEKGVCYDEPDTCSENLKEWFMEIIQTYPPMNGSFAPSPDEIDEWEDTDPIKASRVTDYSLGEDFIYCAFAWSVADEAYEAVKSLAEKHHIGFFDASGSEGDIFDNI